jgi:hypothetical protein
VASPVLRITVTVDLPKDLDKLDDIVSGLKTLADAHEVPWDKVSTYVGKYGEKSRLDAFWSTPAIT